MSSNPSAFGFGSASIHIRSSIAICAAAALGGPNVAPPSSDLPTVTFASVRLEYARSLPVAETDGAVSFGPIAKSQSPPPAVWSGKPRYLDVEPSCETLKALQPAGTPIGPITYELPYWSVRMLGSAALAEPLRDRLGLKVPAPVRVGALAAELEAVACEACSPASETTASVPSAAAASAARSRILRGCFTTVLLVRGDFPLKTRARAKTCSGGEKFLRSYAGGLRPGWSM